MIKTVISGRATGEVIAPPSKSMAHRLLICAGLSTGTSVIRGLEFSEDILATLDCLRALGAQINCSEGSVTLRGIDPRSLSGKATLRLPCRESGSTMRFFLPIALLGKQPVFLEGKGRLPKRPMAIYEAICREQGLRFEQNETGITVCGPLKAGNFSMPGNSSSQFLTGLLFALPLLEKDSAVTLTTSLESQPYVDMTLEALQKSRIRLPHKSVNVIHIFGGQYYSPIEAAVEGDYSNTAFWAALNLMGGDVHITGLSPNSKQGDKIYLPYFEELQKGTPMLSVKDCPDLAPILMTLAAVHHGAVLTDTQRLKLKESDRGQTMAAELRKFGAVISVEDHQIIIHKTTLHKPSERLQGHNDHRIVMSLAVLATRFGGTIEEAEAVNKSYPAFWEQLKSLGIGVTDN